VQATVPPNTGLQRFFGVSPFGRDAEPWHVGALGELDVARRLGGLGPGWYVLHAVPVGTGSGDLDHVVIGSAGVFTINTKHHRGQNVWVGGRRILVNGQRTDHLRNAKHKAKRTSQLLSVAARSLIDVTPIVAVVGPGVIPAAREAGLDQGLVQQPAGVIAGEGPPRAIGAGAAGRETRDQQPGVRIAEGRGGAVPPVGVLAGVLLAILDQARAQGAVAGGLGSQAH